MLSIKEIHKINLRDGDLIFIPDADQRNVDEFCNILNKKFPEKRFLVVNTKAKQIKGIKVIRMKGR